MKRLFITLVGLGLCLYALSGVASAQAVRTWVSGLGDDVNPCSRTAPCKTFAGAYSKTAAGGEIDVIDPGGFGAVTIGKSITIDGGGGLMASILQSGGANALIINGGPNDNIIVRNLAFEGISNSFSPATSGIVFNSGHSLSIEHCVIENFAAYGIFMSTSAKAFINIRDTTVDNAGVAGIYSTSSVSSGKNQVNVTNSAVYNSAIGIKANQHAAFTITGSTVSSNSGDGIVADGTAAIAILQQVTVSRNVNGLHASNGGVIDVGQSTIVENAGTGLLGDTGLVNSWGDNYVTGNGVNGTPNGALTRI